ncbi:hypothetical protein [Nocardioides sp. NPDC004968]|uniref:hypothetical protein n=1 Tax=Nocardioides sp. NPDC004968 TaxID=3155894 RepID=UPI0033A0E545
MTNEHMSDPKPDTGLIWALLWFGAIGSGMGYALIFADSVPVRIFGFVLVAICGVMMSIGILGAGVSVGIRAARGKAAPTVAAPAHVDHR